MQNGTSKANKLAYESRFRHRVLLAAAATAAAAFLTGSPTTHAQTVSGTWTNTTTGGAWSNSANWASGNVASGTDAVADFSTLTLSGSNLVHLDNSYTVGQLNFGDQGNQYGWSLDNNGTSGNVLTLATSTTSAPVVNVINRTAAISTALAGSQGLTKTGAGMLTLTGSNTYTGTTTISAGTLVLGTVGGISGPTSGAAVYLDAGSGLTTNSSGAVTGWSDLSGSGNNATTNTGSVTTTLQGIGGHKSLVFNGSSSLADAISTTNSSGTIFAVFEPTTTSGNAQAIVGSTTTGGVELRMNGGALDLLSQYSADEGSSTTAVTAGVGSVAGVTYSSSGGNFYLNSSTPAGSTNSFAPFGGGTTLIGVGPYGQDGLNGNLAALIEYTSVLTPTQIAQTEQYLTNQYLSSSTLPSTSVINLSNSGAALSLANGAQTIAELSGVAGTNVYLGGGVLTVGDSNDTVYAGGIADTGTGSVGTGGGLVKQNSGSLTLSGPISYTGGTAVTGGTLVLSGTDTTTGGFTVNSGGTLVLSGTSTATGPVTVNSGGILQLQANSGNTTAGVSNALGNPGAFNLNGTLQLRSDTSVAFANTGVSNGYQSFNYDVNSSSGTTTNQTITITAPNPTYNNTINVTGANGYTLALGSIPTCYGGYVNINAISANVTLASVGTSSGANPLALNASGGNITVTGTIGTSGDGAANTVNVAASYSTSVYGTIYGSSLTMTGAGTLQIGNGSSGSLSISSGINISGGTLVLDQPTGTTVSAGISNGGTIIGAVGSGITNTLSGAITGTGSLVLTGAGTIILSGSNSYSGGTTISAGKLLVNGSLAAGSAVSVAPGAFLGGTGTVNGPVTVGTGTGGGGGFNLTAVPVGTLTLTNAAGLSLGNSATATPITFGVGSANDALSLGANTLTVGSSGIAITITPIASILAGNTYNLMTFGAGTGPGFATGTGTTVGGLTLDSGSSVLGFGVSGTLNVTSTAVQLVTSGTVAPATVYWLGNQGTLWTSNNGTTSSNFSANANGTGLVSAFPAASSDVVFAATGATNLNNTLGQSFEIKGLSFLAQDAGSNTIGAVSLGNTTDGYTLQVDADGITDNNTHGVTLQTTTIIAGTSETWTNSTAAPLTISAAVTGTASSGNTTTLTLSGTSSGSTTLSGNIGDGSGGGNLAIVVTNSAGATTVLSGSSTYSGGTTINAGVLSISSDQNTGIVPSSVTPDNIILNGGDLLGSGTFALTASRGIGIGPGSGATGGTGLIDAAAGQTLTVAGIVASAGNTGTNNLTINGEGGTGTVVLSGSNTFNGMTVISGGTLTLGAATALQNSTLNYNNQGGTLSFGTLSTATLGGLTGSQNLTLSNASGGAVNLTVGNNNSTTTYSGILSGVGGLTAVGTGTLTLSGNETFSGSLTVDSTVVLSGNNIGRPSNADYLTSVNGGGILQLQANSANTVSGISYALSSEATANGPLALEPGATLQLRSDSSVTFAGGNNMNGLGYATATIDVNQLTAAGSNNTITLAPLGFATYYTTINVTGGNGYSLALGPIITGYGEYGGNVTVNAISANVTFNGGITDVATLTFNGSFNSTVTGYVISVGTLIKNGTGVLVLSGGGTSIGPTTVNVGTLVDTRNSLLSGAASSLNINGSMIIQNSPSLANITQQVAGGYNGGAWNGSSSSAGIPITSSAAASDPTHLYALGVIQNDNGMGTPLYSTFEGYGALNDSDVLIKYTYYGDANLDGKVDSSDYSRIDNGYLSNLTGWFNGDFNYDGVINGSDYTLIDNAFNTQGASLASEVANPTASIAAQIAGGGTSAVPEPASLGLIGIGAVGLLGRRQRRRR